MRLCYERGLFIFLLSAFLLVIGHQITVHLVSSAVVLFFFSFVPTMRAKICILRNNANNPSNVSSHNQ